MQPDAEGFLYPVVDASLCIECGLCEKVCPVLHRLRRTRNRLLCGPMPVATG
ncbi:MAG: 4Fe-4S binding protein [Alistipes indistinctus]